ECYCIPSLLIFKTLVGDYSDENENHLVVAPQSPVLEMGTTFTATCMIINTAEITSDDLYWNLSKTIIPREQYTKVNRSALNVTISVSNENCEWLFCLCKEVSASIALNKGRFIHGILLKKGYRPVKPENLTCVALQEKIYISSIITCRWDSVGRQTKDVPTKYTLYLTVTLPGEHFNKTTTENRAQITFSMFPSFMELDIWVVAHNQLGAVESEHLKKESDCFVKTNPPADVRVISERSFPTSLLINWTRPIDKGLMGLTYQIRFSKNASQSWTYVPRGETSNDIQSFRIQNLQPDTVYVTQVRCKNAKESYCHWSDWTHGVTKRTPEDRVPPACMILTHNLQSVTFLKWERIPVNRSEEDYHPTQRKFDVLKDIQLPDRKSVKVEVIAVNSVGASATASLVVPEKGHERSPVEALRIWTQGGQLWLEWKPPNKSALSEYVVEWVSDNQVDWQRENRSTRLTAIKGNLKRFVCYSVSVYPIYSGWPGKAAKMEAYLEQEAPLKGPDVRLNGKPGRTHAELVWTEISARERRGFITNYTIFYSSDTKHTVVVPANTTSYTLTSLSGNTKYDICIGASTIAGLTIGSTHSFTTLKYEDGVIEFIVVGASLGFLFVVIMTLLLCVYKKDVIKRNFWPQIPNPGESTIGNWSPDYPLKAETPKENSLSGISVLNVDVCDAKCVFEEDKTSLSLKKDKYLSEEHSSGIGGSSCMSSPRQSVSDSDEGGDIADTTASTIQYSSVVASSGYKGQTPSTQPQQAVFSRSESTQPLLDCEENPDMQEVSRQSQHFPTQSCFTHATGNKDGNIRLEAEQQNEPLNFCLLDKRLPTEEQSPDWLPVTPASSYMPQLGGYRPQ
uniref:Fibronectin type-III domain-containing protein n=1 Tax=Echeneis naucrates TaxID=173247 RepID=A0A665T640_ECHNA